MFKDDLDRFGLDLDDIDGEMTKNICLMVILSTCSLCLLFFSDDFNRGDLIRQPPIGDVIVLRVNMCKPGHFWVI